MAGAPVRIVLWEPQDSLNIGSVVRVCRNTAISDLVVVRPGSWDIDRIATTAPHCRDWVAQHVRTCDGWDDAMRDVTRAWALTARAREERVQRSRLDAAVDQMGRDGHDALTAFVFGREDSGLPNDVIERCGGFVTLETCAEYASLNLAQAVLLVAHAVFKAHGDVVPLKPAARRFDRAPLDQVERMIVQLDQALDAVGFFKGDQRRNVADTLRRTLLRAELDRQELATWWGVFKEIARNAQR